MSRRFTERRNATRPLNILPAQPDRPRQALTAGVVLGAVRYGPSFLAQVVFLYLAMVIGEVVAAGRTGGRLQLELGLLVAAGAMGLAEATFRLYKRVWAVAGLSDAIALALAVIEACALVTLAEALIPPVWRPFPIAIPILVAPIVLSGIAPFRLLPRLLLRPPTPENPPL